MKFAYKIGKHLWWFFIWLRSWGNSRGYGVQSPWAYQFIRDVICERHPYYAYERLFQIFPDTDKLTRRLAKLYFRIANYSRAGTWSFCLCHYAVKEAYVKEGRQNCHVIGRAGVDEENCRDILFQSDILVMSLDEKWKFVYTAFASHTQPSSILIVENIHASKKSLRAWHWIQEDERSCVTIDLYHCGIVFFNKRLYKQHYMVNLP